MKKHKNYLLWGYAVMLWLSMAQGMEAGPDTLVLDLSQRTDWEAAFSIAHKENLETLCLVHNKMRAKEVQVITAYDLPHLKKLDLTGNTLEDEGLLALGKKEFPALEELILTHNGILDLGIGIFYARSFLQLTRLDLSCNSLADNSMWALYGGFTTAKIFVAFIQ